MDILSFRSEIGHLLHALRTDFQRLVEPIARAEGITILQLMVLDSIGNLGGDVNINAVCSATGMSQANASTLCKRMEQDGLIKRERSRQDERVVNLSLTDQGQDAIERVFTSFCRYSDMLESYPDQETMTIIKGLHSTHRLIQAMLEYNVNARPMP